MKKKKSIIKKLSKKKNGSVGVDYTLTSKEKKNILFYVFSIAIPAIIGILILALR